MSFSKSDLRSSVVLVFMLLNFVFSAFAGLNSSKANAAIDFSHPSKKEALQIKDEENKFWTIEVSDSENKIELPKIPRTINVFSGIPLYYSLDEHDSGGWGDVASNLLMAKRLALKHPEIKINFIVIDKKYITQSEIDRRKVSKSSDIVHALMPDFNPLIKDQPQFVDGVYVTFSSFSWEDTRHDPFFEDKIHLLPSADLSIQFSANGAGNFKAMLYSAPVNFSFYEFGSLVGAKETAASSNKPVLIGQDIITRGEPLDKLRHGNYSSGPGTLGYYQDPLADLEDSELINILNKNLPSLLLINGKNINLKNQSIAFAYAKDPNKLQAYTQLIIKYANKHPNENVLLITRDISANRDSLPNNVNLFLWENLPSDVVSACIHLSKIPPLVRGDVSLSTALSTMHKKNRFFFYELEPFKGNLYESLQNWIHKNMSEQPYESFFNNIEAALNFGYPRNLMYYSNKKNEGKTPADLYMDIIEDTNLTNTIFNIVRAHKSEKDLAENALKIYQLHSLFETYFRNNPDLKLNVISFLLPHFIIQGSLVKLKEHFLSAFEKEDPRTLLLKEVLDLDYSLYDRDILPIAFITLFQLGAFENKNELFNKYINKISTNGVKKLITFSRENAEFAKMLQKVDLQSIRFRTEKNKDLISEKDISCRKSLKMSE